MGWLAPWTSLARRPGSLSISGSQSPFPAPFLAGVETESQGGAATHTGVTATPVPGSGPALSVHAAPVGSILCSGALNSSLPRGGRPGPERPRPWPHSSQKVEPRSPRPPEHSPSCCLDRPAPQHPARALPPSLCPSWLPAPLPGRQPAPSGGPQGLWGL